MYPTIVPKVYLGYNRRVHSRPLTDTGKAVMARLAFAQPWAVADLLASITASVAPADKLAVALGELFDAVIWSLPDAAAGHCLDCNCQQDAAALQQGERRHAHGP